ncbi:unnamed protein product [Rhizophagus irregularis]|nr:unnamed protein product [Rhizophagus irregularis]
MRVFTSGVICIICVICTATLFTQRNENKNSQVILMNITCASVFYYNYEKTIASVGVTGLENTGVSTDGVTGLDTAGESSDYATTDDSLGDRSDLPEEELDCRSFRSRDW